MKAALWHDETLLFHCNGFGQMEQVRAKAEDCVDIGKPEGIYIFVGSGFLEKGTIIENIMLQLVR